MDAAGRGGSSPPSVAIRPCSIPGTTCRCWQEAAELDVADIAATDRFLGDLDLASLDGAVLAAGHDLGGNTPFADEPRATWESKLAVNAAAAMRITAALLPAFLARDRGDVVAMGSIVTRNSAQGLASYAASKQALRGFMEGLRLNYADTGLRFIEIVPGVIRTEFAASRLEGDEAAAAAFYERFKGCLTRRMWPARRFGRSRSRTGSRSRRS